MLLKTNLSFLFFCCISAVFAQRDSNAIFLASKGTWKYPLDNREKISEHIYHYQQLFHETFYAATPEPIYALMPGKVVLNKEIDGMYIVMVRFADYSLTYSNLLKSPLKKGDQIKQDQFIGLPAKDFLEENRYSVDIYLSNKNGDFELNLPDWFKKQCRPEPFLAF